MMQRHIPETQWTLLSEFIAGRIGLHFSPERRDELQRGFSRAAEEFGFNDPATCIDWLLTAPSSRSHLDVLASHLTIGETYFFRDKQTFDVLAQHVLPELINERRGHDQQLRLWSAACCSGEEAYSLAILLHQLLPDIADWHITINATDINMQFLQKANIGVYSEWSFRNVPPWIRQRYFVRTEDGRYAVIPAIKKLVTFAHLNLVEDMYPSPATNTNAMDIIFCRNVLMYFSPGQVNKVINNLGAALVEGGWLGVSPSEVSTVLFPQFVSVDFSEAILFQKKASQLEANFKTSISDKEPAMTAGSQAFLEHATVLYEKCCYSEVADLLLSAFSAHLLEPAGYSLLARALANQGKLQEALAWSDRWIALDKLDAASHYLRAAILLEQGDAAQARQSLKQAIYLDPDFVLAHFALGNLARSNGRKTEAGKHYANALRLLRNYQAHDLVPESDGLAAGGLNEYITSLIIMENLE